MKVISLDVGTVRIGIAKADSSVRIAVPYGTIQVDGTEYEQIARLSRVYGTECFVLGLPRNSRGEETAQSEYVRKTFAPALKKAIPGAKICFQDESLTSVEAEKRLSSRKKGFKKEEIDTEAAVIILQDFLENIGNPAKKKQKSLETPLESPGTSARPVVECDPRKIKKARRKTQEGSKKRSHKIEIILISLVFFLGLGAFFWTNWYHENLDPIYKNLSCEDDVSSEACRYITLAVEEGSTLSQIADRLAEVGLIKNSLAFQLYARLDGVANYLKAGDYELRRVMSVPEIITALVNGATSGNVFRLTIIPGETITSIKKKLVLAGYPEEEVEAAFSATYNHPVLEGKPASASLEGYIFGETYEFYIGESLQNIILTTLDELYNVVKKNNLIEAFAAHGLSLYQGITLASVVQREAKTADQPGVAQVFYKRLSLGLRLDADATTKYSLDIVDPARNTYQDNQSALKVEECHNTRLYAGLPCGPISNPGTSALNAVANPADEDYLYFLTGDDGKMYYGYTEADHQYNIRTYCQKLCNILL